MKQFTIIESSSKEGFVYLYSGKSKDELAKKTKQIFINSGYQTVSEVLKNATYEKGNRMMRILFGAFSKYFKFKIEIKETENDGLSLQLKRATTGMSGGVIGMKQVTKEIERLSALFQEF
jgi:hypothetical protein